MAHPKPLVLKLSGVLDRSKEDALREHLKKTYRTAAVVIDFHGVKELDSSALSALLVKRRIRRENGYEPARFVGLSPDLQRIFKAAKLVSVWPWYEDLSEAIASFN